MLSNPKGKFGFLLVRDFEEFSNSISRYVKYAVHEIEPLVIACLQQESNCPSCPPTQQAKNGQLISTLRNYSRSLTTLSDQIEQLVKAPDSTAALEDVEYLTIIVSQLNLQAAELNSVYKAKATDEAQLPTVSEALKDTKKHCIFKNKMCNDHNLFLFLDTKRLSKVNVFFN